MNKLRPELILAAYRAGAFPMADARDSADQEFYQPIDRGVFDLRQAGAVRVPRRFQRWLRQCPYTLKVDQDFDRVIAACAAVPRARQGGTWINGEIERVFCQLHQQGHAHCFSAYDAQGRLVGGLYGLHQGSVFFGESMFTLAPNASKACLVGLFAALSQAGFDMIDAQMPNPHLDQFGLQVWQNERFLTALPQWLRRPCDFPKTISAGLIHQFLQSTTQTS